MTTPESRAELRRLGAEANPSGEEWSCAGDTLVCNNGASYMVWRPRGVFIAAAVNAVPALCDEVDALEAEVARLREACSGAADLLDPEEFGTGTPRSDSLKLDHPITAAIRARLCAAVAPPNGKDGK